MLEMLDFMSKIARARGAKGTESGGFAPFFLSEPQHTLLEKIASIFSHRSGTFLRLVAASRGW
jgi:hypothetical protein